MGQIDKNFVGEDQVDPWSDPGHRNRDLQEVTIPVADILGTRSVEKSLLEATPTYQGSKCKSVAPQPSLPAAVLIEIVLEGEWTACGNPVPTKPDAVAFVQGIPQGGTNDALRKSGGIVSKTSLRLHLGSLPANDPVAKTTPQV